MNDILSSFWTTRLRQHGHTGWSDPFIYAFDQAERLEEVRPLIASLHLQGKRAVDFGCGTGDFSKLLLELGFEVCGYDPFVKPKIEDQKFNYVSELRKIPFPSGTVDVIISVTVMDHILDDNLLAEHIKYLKELLCRDGQLILLEYAMDEEISVWEANRSDRYQALRSLKSWTRILESHDIHIYRLVPFFHPVFSPSKRYIKYSNNLFVRVMRKLDRVHVWNRLRNWLLTWYAGRLLRTQTAESCSRSPLKLIIARRSGIEG